MKKISYNILIRYISETSPINLQSNFMDYDKWYDMVKSITSETKDQLLKQKLHPLLLLDRGIPDDRTTYLTTNTDEDSKIQCPSISKESVEKWINWLSNK